MRIRRKRRERGMTVIELIFASSVAASMLAAGFALTASMSSGSAAANKRNALASHAEEVVERIARELSVAGMSGEDANKSGTLDPGEDTNRNGRLDADWTLADGATASDFTFNVMRSDWTWSGPVRWYVSADSVLLRTENGAATEMARGVQTFTVTRTADEIDMHLTLNGVDVTGQPQSQSSERRVYVRN